MSRLVYGWAEKFMARVQASEGCWLWSGAPDSGGYGRMSIEGKQTRTHVLSYLLHNGEIPEGMLVRHTCDVPLCVRPDHLILGTPKDNAQDMVERGRHGNQKKERCVNGHEFNRIAYYNGRPYRQCDTCARERAAAWQAARRSA